jgi:hypothetical protein
MAIRREVHSSLSNLTLGGLRAYLRSHGYSYREPWGKLLHRYSRKNNSREDNVLVPAAITMSDYERRLAEALDSIARQLDIPWDAVLRDVANAGYEIIRIRVNEGTNTSTIPYDTSIDLLRGGFALIDASATLAISDEHLSIIRGRRPDVVRKYLDEVRVGQTEVGSFVLTLLMPVGVDDAGFNLPAQVSDGFGTKVSETFSQSLQAAEEAVRGNGFRSNKALIENGVTANFSGGVARIIESAGDVSISLSQVASRHPGLKRTIAKFSSSDSIQLREIEDRLTPSEDAEPFTATGTIVEFREPRGKNVGSIVLNCYVHGEMRPVRMKFDREDRATVIYAIEKKSDVFLEVDGDLISRSGHFHIERPVFFRTVPRGPLT